MKRILMWAVLLPFLFASGAGARTQKIPQLHVTQKFRVPNDTDCSTLGTPLQAGDLCWDSDDALFRVYNGSTFVTISAPDTGSFALNTGDTLSGTYNFSGAIASTTDGLGISFGNNANTNKTILTADRSGTNSQLRWLETGQQWEFSVASGLFDNGLNTTIIEDGIEIEDKIVAHGSTGSSNGFETTITFTDPTADRAVTFPDAAGTFMLNNAGATMGANTAADITLTFDIDTTDPTILWDDSADVLAITTAALKHAECSDTAVAATVTIDACDVVTFTGTGTIVDTINTCGATQKGRLLYVLCSAASVIGDGTGNVQLVGAANFTCGADDTLTLICEGSTGDWLELSRSVN